MKKFTICLWFLFCGLIAFAQIETPVKWSFSSQDEGNGKVKISIKADIQPGWHVYSQFIKEGGPIPTSFTFTPSKDYTLIGTVTESPKAISSFDKNFNMQIAWHEKQAIFKQLIKINKATSVKGTLEFMACNDEKCLPPEEVPFDIPVSMTAQVAIPSTLKTNSNSSQNNITPSESLKIDTVNQTTPAENTIPLKNTNNNQPQNEKDNTLAGIFIACFLSGLAAFFMPCIYPMVPLTVSFFTKRAGSRSKGIQSAVIYGLSIILIYVLLGVLVTALFGPDALNSFASSAEFNLTFFVILIIFGISFLGAFEITLPSSLVNKIDEKSNKNGALGIFFMALTLAVVSFSCTGPIVGSLLGVISQGNYLSPIVGMFGFSLALALPFVLFAIFPGLLKEMPKSGGWLNTVKVSLGFLELALAFKFLSNVDLAYHWELLNRDVFLIIWITIFGILGYYLLGKLKLAHDIDLPFLSLTRLFFAAIVLGFTLYMIPGLWGAPLKSLSGWLPPIGTQEFNLVNKQLANTQKSDVKKKYKNLFHPAHNLDAFYDYEEGLAYAKKVNKPVLLDFTGHSCANCRRMEGSVWSDPRVFNLLNNDYVLISLYVDDRTELAEKEKYVSESGKKIKTLGNKWSDLQTKVFKTNSQPYYVIVNSEGKTLVPPQAFNLDIQNYINFLDSGKAAFSKQ